MSDSASPPPSPEPTHPSPDPPTPLVPQPIFDPNLFPSRHRPLGQWLLDHNPCLLLSTVLMLLGCFLVNGAIGGPDNLRSPLALLVVINIYEACIIPLGLVLIRRTRGAARDGWWLILFEVLLLINATFVNVDFRTGWGVPINLLLFILACIKAAVIMRGLKIGLSLRTFGFFAVQLGMIYGLPIFFSLVKVDGEVSPRIMYGLWWLVGLLPVAYDQIARFDERRRVTADGVSRWDLVQQVIRRVYLIAPWVLLVAHMRFAHWAHNSDFQWALIAPLFLGLAIASMRLRLVGLPHFWMRLLPVAAVLVAMTAGRPLSWMIDVTGTGHTLTPAHVTMAAALLTYGYLASPFYFACSAATVLLAAIGYCFQGWIVIALRRTLRFLLDLLPTTVLSWGVTSILLAFVLLAVGSLISLRRTAPPRPG